MERIIFLAPDLFFDPALNMVGNVFTDGRKLLIDGIVRIPKDHKPQRLQHLRPLIIQRSLPLVIMLTVVQLYN